MEMTTILIPIPKRCWEAGEHCQPLLWFFVSRRTICQSATTSVTEGRCSSGHPVSSICRLKDFASGKSCSFWPQSLSQALGVAWNSMWRSDVVLDLQRQTEVLIVTDPAEFTYCEMSLFVSSVSFSALTFIQWDAKSFSKTTIGGVLPPFEEVY